MFFAEITEEDKAKVEDQLDAIIEKTIERGKKRFKKELASACDDLMGNVGLWEQSIRENNSAWDFIRASQKQVWKQMLSSNPEHWSKYQIGDLLKAWQQRHPEELKVSIDAVILERLAQAEKDVKYYRDIVNNR